MILCCFYGYAISLGIFFCPLTHAADVSMFAGGEFDGRGQGFSYLGVDVTQSINKTARLFRKGNAQLPHL